MLSLVKWSCDYSVIMWFSMFLCEMWLPFRFSSCEMEAPFHTTSPRGIERSWQRNFSVDNVTPMQVTWNGNAIPYNILPAWTYVLPLLHSYPLFPLPLEASQVLPEKELLAVSLYRASCFASYRTTSTSYLPPLCIAARTTHVRTRLRQIRARPSPLSLSIYKRSRWLQQSLFSGSQNHIVHKNHSTAVRDVADLNVSEHMDLS